MNTDVSTLFNQFAGQEVAVNEVTIEGKRRNYTQARFANDNDPVLTAMTEFAAQRGLQMRVWLPGTAGTMDHRMDRVNVNVEKDTDGKWRIGKSFTIG